MFVTVCFIKALANQVNWFTHTSCPSSPMSLFRTRFHLIQNHEDVTFPIRGMQEVVLYKIK